MKFQDHKSVGLGCRLKSQHMAGFKLAVLDEKEKITRLSLGKLSRLEVLRLRRCAEQIHNML